MTIELPEELRRYQRQALALGRLIEDAQAQAPQRATGADRAGAVRVTLDRGGLPEQIRLEPRWRRLVGPDALARAIAEAARAAVESRLAAWSRTLDAGDWRRRARRIMGDESPAPAPAPVPVPASLTGSPRDLTTLAEEAMRSAGRLDALARSAPAVAEYTGHSGDREVSLTVSAAAGLTRCRIDPRWAGAATDAAVDRALTQALLSARGKLAAAAGGPAPGAALTSLYGEVLGLLRDPHRLVG